MQRVRLRHRGGQRPDLSGVVDSVLIVAPEIHSRIVDPTGRDTSAIFGDGAGAVVLRRDITADQGALPTLDPCGDGSDHHLIQVPGELEQPHGSRWFGMAGAPPRQGADRAGPGPPDHPCLPRHARVDLRVHLADGLPPAPPAHPTSTRSRHPEGRFHEGSGLRGC
ncbi:hypothetical protein [Streptomyces sp. R44]|uniref:Beta-ketoacyl-[acyl-carrier-protein] synthase III N-terminal domain-containing protein n=1 Tax=Streptomyces sp. R44 TaxID=3238633 RepID=A0AB39TAT6_9ACTN